ncbi:MAG: flagellar protein FliT [Mizugakiibacter sp.]|uniref:flagellar protein FliT n=1 Tax=Mizugakiibacter sp. TaxID=1972610 RepID=UPI0031C2B865|nr:flagellar protein FliT [Xanthomonadaceae bacterium]
MSADALRDLETGLRLSRAMLALARGGDWARVAELQAERAPLLQRDGTLPAAAVPLLRELLAVNAELDACATAARDAAAHAWDATRHGHQGADAYLDAARGGP